MLAARGGRDSRPHRAGGRPRLGDSTRRAAVLGSGRLGRLEGLVELDGADCDFASESARLLADPPAVSRPDRLTFNPDTPSNTARPAIPRLRPIPLRVVRRLLPRQALSDGAWMPSAAG